MSRKSGTRVAGIVLLTILAAVPAPAGDFDIFKDPEDGRFDADEWLLGRSGFLPVPIIITEPAVGYGLGMALAFFHGPRDGNGGPPSVSAVAAGYTESTTWFVGSGHFGSWKNDTIRYTGGLGYADADLEFFVGDRPLEYELRGLFLTQDLRFRLGSSAFFLGPKYVFFGSKSRFSFELDIPGIDPADNQSNNAGLGLIGNFDHRDNIMSPNRGQEITFEVTWYDEIFGGGSMGFVPSSTIRSVTGGSSTR